MYRSVTEFYYGISNLYRKLNFHKFLLAILKKKDAKNIHLKFKFCKFRPLATFTAFYHGSNLYKIFTNISIEHSNRTVNYLRYRGLTMRAYYTGYIYGRRSFCLGVADKIVKFRRSL